MYVFFFFQFKECFYVDVDFVCFKEFFLGEIFLCKEKYGFYVNCLKCLGNFFNWIEYKFFYKGFIC